ncbi:hypothetical protein G0Q06_09115 [Puniceicoccales bacterium CK1056]|uniref:Uncharacterized protein n=1 Tax=Oceanipulchritudo coccoides TaxID=2706888 RepID=A0A6B2M333_9BACT|nr:hypothetical protein [Oceanipulchritudo coccoides]NDV62609.1 hypothetical protein [Oceanipulchritudo coccoides]
MTATNPQTTSTHSPSGKKPNVFQRLWQKLDAKMQAKAEASAGNCCCDDGKSDKKAGDKCC